MSPFGPGTSTRAPGDTLFEISPEATCDEPMCAIPIPRIEPRVSAGVSTTPMRMLPGTGVRTTWTPGCVISSVDCGISTGVDIRLLGGGVGVAVMRGVGFDDDAGGGGVPDGTRSGTFGIPIGSVFAGGLDVARARTLISPEACDRPGSLLTRLLGGGVGVVTVTGGGIVAAVGDRCELAGIGGGAVGGVLFVRGVRIVSVSGGSGSGAGCDAARAVSPLGPTRW